MPGKISIAGTVAVEYLTRYPKSSTLGLAKLLFRDEPAVFRSVKHALDTVRWHRGERSNGRVKACPRPVAARTIESRTAARSSSRIRLPASECEPYEPVHITRDDCRRLLDLSDIHLPYHCPRSISAALRWGERWGSDGVVFNGDTLDCYQLSNFEKDPRKRNVAGELKLWRQLVAAVIERVRPKRIWFKLGNHEERYERYLINHAPALLGLDEIDFTRLISHDERGQPLFGPGIEVIDGKRVIWAGDHLALIHGHEYVKAVLAPVNVARGYFLKAKTCLVVAHHHISHEHSERNLKGKLVRAWSQGCLCGLNPSYMPQNRWNNGFAGIELSADGGFEMHNKVIDSGTVL